MREPFIRQGHRQRAFFSAPRPNYPQFGECSAARIDLDIVDIRFNVDFFACRRARLIWRAVSETGGRSAVRVFEERIPEVCGDVALGKNRDERPCSRCQLSKSITSEMVKMIHKTERLTSIDRVLFNKCFKWRHRI